MDILNTGISIMGHPFKEITPEMIKKAENLASRGLNIEQIAYSLGMHPATLHKKKSQEEHSELNEAIKRGQAAGIENVANSLYDNATIYNNVNAQKFYLKCRAKWKEEEEYIKDDSIAKALLEVLAMKNKD